MLLIQDRRNKIHRTLKDAIAEKVDVKKSIVTVIPLVLDAQVPADAGDVKIRNTQKDN